MGVFSQLGKLFRVHAVFSSETELTPLILASKSEFSQGSHSLYKVI